MTIHEFTTTSYDLIIRYLFFANFAVKPHVYQFDVKFRDTANKYMGVGRLFSWNKPTIHRNLGDSVTESTLHISSCDFTIFILTAHYCSAFGLFANSLK